MSTPPQKRNRAGSTTLKIVVSAALLGAMIWWVGIDQLLDAMRDLDPWLAALSFLLQFFSIALGGVNTVVLVHAVAPELPKRSVFVAYLRSWVIGAIAPGRLGDLSLAHFLTPLDVTYGLGLAVVVVDKFITFLITVAIGAIGILLYVGAQEAAGSAALALVLTGVAVFLIASKRIRGFVRERILGKHSSKFTGFSGYAQGMLRDHPELLALNVGITIFRVVVMAVGVWVMLLAFGQRVDIIAVVFVQTIAQLAAWVPVSMAGIGVREATATVLYTQLLGLPAAPVLNANLLTLVLGYLKAAVLWVVLGFGGGRAGGVGVDEIPAEDDLPSEQR